MKSLLRTLEKLNLEFTDTQLTGSAGLSFLTIMARHYGLLKALDAFGPSERVVLVPCLASGRGALRDLDDLREDRAACHALDHETVAGSRRIGEWLRKLTPRHLAWTRCSPRLRWTNAAASRSGWRWTMPTTVATWWRSLMRTVGLVDLGHQL